MFNKLIGLFICTLIFLTQFAVAENINFNYDNNGNLLEGVNQKYEYNALNQLVKVSDKNGKVLEEYIYDQDGNRIKKTEYLSNGKTQTTYYPSKNLVRVVNSSGTYDTFYVYGEQGTLLARKDSDGKMFYYHPDHLGSTTLITNEAGQIVEETSYLPFGEVWEGGTNSKFLFTGKEKDSTSLMYYGARYYDSFLKRFTQPDTVIQEIYNPQNLNRYSYVLNNPYKYVDPTGNMAWDVTVDPAMFYLAWSDFKDNPSVFNAIDLGLSTLGLLPVLPSLGLMTRGVKVVDEGIDYVKGAKFASKVDDVAKVFKDTGMSKIGKEEWVNVDELFTRQTKIHIWKVDALGDVFTRKGAEVLPPVEIVEINGRKIISNGNHRWQGAISADKSMIKVKYVDAEKAAYGWGDNLATFYEKAHRGELYEWI